MLRRVLPDDGAERPGLGVQVPQPVGESVGGEQLVTAVDTAGDDQLGDMDALGLQDVVEHLPVRGFTGEGD